MSVATEKMPVDCPQCGKQLMVPVTAAGKQGRCPACSNVFQLTAPPVAELVPEEPDYGLQALPEQPAAPAINPYAPSAAPANSYYDKAPAPEKSGGWWGTALGGVAMMVIAVVWFFGALLLADRIFFYPPILFIIGLVTFFKGLFSGSSS